MDGPAWTEAQAGAQMDALFTGVQDLVAYRFKRHHDGRREMVWVSSTIEALFGLDRNAVMADFGVWMDALDADDQPRILAAENEARRTGERAVLDVRATVRGHARMMRMSVHPTLLDDKIVLWNGLMRDITHEVGRSSERDRLAAMIEGTDDFAGIAAADGSVLYLNPAARGLLRMPRDHDETTMSIDRFHPPSTATRFPDEIFPAIMARGNWSGDLELQDFEGGVRPVSAVVMVHRDARGEPTHFSTIMRDISQRDRMARELRLVNRELNHRVKNLFSVMQALVTMSARGETDVAQLIAKLKSRMEALAAAHLMSTEVELGRNALRPVPFADLLQSILKPYERDERHLTVAGPPVRLPHEMLTPIGLIVHELATNAVKYGAWADEDGSIDVEWAAQRHEDGTQTVRLDWRETSPTLIRGRRGEGVHMGRGFGSRLMQMSARQMQGDVEQTWRDEGLVTRLSILVPVPLPEGEDGPAAQEDAA